MNGRNPRLVGRKSLALAVALLDLVCWFQAAAQSRGGLINVDNTDQKSLQVPVGTVLPVILNRRFSTKNVRGGQVITGRIMQDVPLPGGGKIPKGARAIGTILSVTPAGSSGGARISFRFNELEIHHRRSAVVTDLRALASALEVEFAQIPERTPDFGTPYHWAATQQVGGDERYGVGGPVTDRWNNLMGEGVWGGVLVHVRAQPGTPCRGALDAEDRLQALWVFSADACGVYGMAGVTIAHAGRTEPVGEIVLTAESGEIKMRSGSGMLLRVIR